MSPIILVLIFFALIIIWGISYNNKIVVYDNEVKEKGVSIETQLQRRGELIPNLVSTVKGYAKHEHDTMTDVIAKRNGNVDKENQDLQNLTNAATQVEDVVKQVNAQKTLEARNHQNNLIPMDRLMMLTENYPQLQAFKNFASLQEELSNTENLILGSRQLYNNAIKSYNNTIQVFPGSIIAGFRHAEIKEQLEVPEASKQPVQVNF